MSLGSHKKPWEPVAISLLIGLIVVTFAYTLFQVLRKTSRTLSRKPVVVSPAPSTSAVVRTSSYYRPYKRSLALHELGSEWQHRPEASKEADDYNIANPQMRRESNPMASIDPVEMPMPVMVPPPRVRKDKDEKDEEESTGWGWLADDIESSRRERDDRDAGEKQTQDDATVAGSADEKPAPGDAEPADKEKSFFIDSAFGQQKLDSESRYGIYRDVQPLNDYAQREIENAADGDDRDLIDNGTARARDASPIRNPFEASADAQNEANLEAGSAFAIQTPFQMPGASSASASESAASPVAPLSGYGRDATAQESTLFGGGSTYESPALGGSRSESIFSTDSLFGGDQMFVRDNGAVAAGSGALSAPAEQGGLDSRYREDPNFKKPSALSW